MAEIAFDDQCVGANPCDARVADLERLFWESYDGQVPATDARPPLEIHVEATGTPTSPG
jgi:hypothetical protein